MLKECIKKKINVFPIPGVSAVTTALSVSGFDEKYFFYGFLPKESQLKKLVEELQNYNYNIVFFIPALKFNYYLKFLKKYFKDRDLFVAREMTKIYENFYRDSLESFSNFKDSTKGEITVVLSRKKEGYVFNKKKVDDKELRVEILKYLKRYTLKDVVKLVSEKNNLSKKQVYDLCLKIKND